MTTFNPGDVVLVRFPFTDLSQSKKRPAVVVSPVEYQSMMGDLVLVPLTSQQVDWSVQAQGLALHFWKPAGLLKPTWAKPLLATISKAFILKRLGKIHEQDAATISKALRLMLDADLIESLQAA